MAVGVVPEAPNRVSGSESVRHVSPSTNMDLLPGRLPSSSVKPFYPQVGSEQKAGTNKNEQNTRKRREGKKKQSKSGWAHHLLSNELVVVKGLAE